MFGYLIKRIYAEIGLYMTIEEARTLDKEGYVYLDRDGVFIYHDIELDVFKYVALDEFKVKQIPGNMMTIKNRRVIKFIDIKRYRTIDKNTGMEFNFNLFLKALSNEDIKVMVITTIDNMLSLNGSYSIYCSLSEISLVHEKGYNVVIQYR